MDKSDRLLSRQDIAELGGIAVNTVDVYRQRGIIPAPDGRLGNKPYWYYSTIKREFLDKRQPPGWHGQLRNRSRKTR